MLFPHTPRVIPPLLDTFLAMILSVMKQYSVGLTYDRVESILRLVVS